MTGSKIFKLLTTSVPQPLKNLPDTYGIYALWDHEGEIRYIGCTPKETEGFRIRVQNKHVTGTEGRSHKFSQAYCTGRMWRYCAKLAPEQANSEQNKEDAKLAKKLRTLFIRRHCKVTFVEVPNSENSGNYFGYLTKLESEVQQLAPDSMMSWGGIRFKPLDEPVELIDRLIEENPLLKESAEKQNKIYKKYVGTPNVDDA